MKILTGLWRWLRRLFTRRAVRFRTVIVDELPEVVRPRAVYLVGENGLHWCAALLCPCGCRALIQLNLMASTRPAWQASRSPSTGLVTLSPSIWRTQGCRSHFFLHDGRIDWCESRRASPGGTRTAEAVARVSRWLTRWFSCALRALPTRRYTR